LWFISSIKISTFHLIIAEEGFPLPSIQVTGVASLPRRMTARDRAGTKDSQKFTFEGVDQEGDR
jgi:hypothetical protein